jgi:hypothetical protein
LNVNCCLIIGVLPAGMLTQLTAAAGSTLAVARTCRCASNEQQQSCKRYKASHDVLGTARIIQTMLSDHCSTVLLHITGWYCQCCLGMAAVHALFLNEVQTNKVATGQLLSIS